MAFAAVLMRTSDPGHCYPAVLTVHRSVSGLMDFCISTKYVYNNSLFYSRDTTMLPGSSPAPAT